MKKIIIASTLVLLCSLVGEAQSTEMRPIPLGDLTVEYLDKCPNPVYESMAWSSIEGTVVKVIDGDSIIVLTKDKERKQIDLAAIDASTSKALSRRELTELVLNREVEVWVSSRKFESKRVDGVVHVRGKDVNRELLKAGSVKYKKPKSYSMSSYKDCVYRIIEGEARDARRGLWRN
jgi:endonuclease YncB( thermonuclease family)